MNILSVIGSFIITFALLSYGIGSISVMRFKLLTRWVILFLTLGLFLDIVAIGFMIAGSHNSPFSLHGIIGYIALLAMLINVILIWREYRLKGIDSQISFKIVRYTKFAYLWWLIIYFAGSVMILW